MFKFIICLLYISFATAQDFSSFGFNSQVGPESKKPEKNNTSPLKPKAAPKECTSKDQSSLPLRDVNALMIYKGGKLEVYPSAGGDLLNVKSTSKIIGNCRSMLEPTIELSKKYNKYVYEVRIRKTCQESECPYPVTVKDKNGAIKSVPNKMYEPTLAGFYKCMQENVGLVEKDGVKSWDDSKIVRKELPKAQASSPATNDLYFVSKGPMASQYSDKTNLIENDQCDYFEDISDGGYVHFSREDVEQKRLEEQAQALCKNGSYSDIENGLDLFEGNDKLYSNLMQVRDQLLLKEMQRYKAKFDEAAEDKDLSVLDQKKYNKLLKDFYALIIDKNISSKNHNDEDEMNPDLLVNIVEELKKAASAGDDVRVKELREKLALKASELAKYIQKPYFTPADYIKAVDLKLKPNFESNEWANAVKDMHKSIVTVKLLCEAYGADKPACAVAKFKSPNFKVKKSTIPSLRKVRSKADVYSKAAVSRYKKKYDLIKTPNSYRSIAFQKKLKHCAGHGQVANQYAYQAQSIAPQMGQHCMQQAGNSQHAYQMCLQRYQSQISIDANGLNGLIKDCQDNQANYTNEAKRWASLEKDRDLYLGLTEAESKKKHDTAVAKTLNDNYQYDFAFRGLQRSNYSNVLSTQPSLSTPGFNQGFQSYNTFRSPSSFNTGFNSNLNTGFNTGFNTGYNNFNTGFNTSLNTGFNTGFNTGHNNFNTGFNTGLNTGFNTGFNTFGNPNGFNTFGNQGTFHTFGGPQQLNTFGNGLTRPYSPMGPQFIR